MESFLNEMLEDSLTSAKKIYDKAGNIISDNSGKLGIFLTGLGVTGMADEFVADFMKYKSQGRSDTIAGIGAGAETLRDVGIDVATGLNIPRNIAQFSLIGSPAGEGTDVVRETGKTQAGRQIPQRQIGMESESANFLNQIQSNLQSEGTSETQALNIIEQDTNIGNKMGTFGRTPDVSPGFVTPPSKSDLADETQRQQNFMGVN